MEKNDSHSPYRPLNITIILFLVTCFLDRVVQEGMFFDGITYAAISRNLAIGKGELWNVYYRGNWRFSEHPPLMFGIESLFFRVFGDHYYTEKIFSLTIWMLSVITMKYLWDRTDATKTIKPAFGLALLCWGIISVVMWAYPNNLLDSTMALFDMGAVYFIYRGLLGDKPSYLQLCTGAAFIFFATLTKGPVGMFPLAVPAMHWLVYRRHSFGKSIVYTLLLTVLLCAMYMALYCYPPARACINGYLDEQVFKALAGKRDVVDSPLGRFQLIPELFIQLLPSMILVLIVFLPAKLLQKKTVVEKSIRQHAWFYLLLALSASLPIILSLKQRPFYLLPALPYYAFAMALFVYPWYSALMDSLHIGFKANRIIKITMVVACIGAGGYIATKFGQVGRDQELIADIKTLQQIVPEGEKIGICNGMNYDFALLAYIERYHKTEVDLRYHIPRYVLLDWTQCSGDLGPCLIKLGHKEVPTRLVHYRLFKRELPYSPTSDLPESK